MVFKPSIQQILQQYDIEGKKHVQLHTKFPVHQKNSNANK